VPVLRYLTAGESHGPALVAVIEGLPAGLDVSEAYINRQLRRRQGGYGRGGRMAIESDQVGFLAGIRGGKTLGSPVAMMIENKDWRNWAGVMAQGKEAHLDERVITRPRPGHADLAGALKYGHRDIRNVLERASARETAARVAAGTLARRLLEELGIEILGGVVRIGGVAAAMPDLPAVQLRALLDASPVMCADPGATRQMMEEIDRARNRGDSLGGVFEIRAEKLGSEVHDEIFYEPGRGFFRPTNRAGGLEGGVTNGETVVIRAAMKPIPTLRQPLHSVDLITRESSVAAVERSDICAVPAACVIGEAAVAWELAAACLEKFGGDSMDELQRNYRTYLEAVREA